MSKIDMFGRITRLLVSACVVPAGLGLSILQTQAAGMPGLAGNESPCVDTTSQATGDSASRSACDCPHCREANSSDSRLVRFFKSRCTKTKWAERTPKNTWKCYHPCAPYFEPTFGVHQTSWTILPHDACELPFATPLFDAHDHLQSARELDSSPRPKVQLAAQRKAQPAVQPKALPESQTDASGEARNEAKPRRVTPAAAKTFTGDSRRHFEQQPVVPASGTSEKIELPQTSSPQNSVSRSDFHCQPLPPTEAPAAPPSIRSFKRAPRNNVPITNGPSQPVSENVAPYKAFEFDKRTPDSLFTSHNDPIFRTRPADDSRAVSHVN